MAKKIIAFSNKVRRRWLKIWGGFFSALLGFLGLQSCPGPIVLYGPPPPDHVHVKVSGIVREADTTLAITNIKVTGSVSGTARDMTTTSADGSYQLDVIFMGYPADKVFDVRFEDMDGSSNGGPYAALDAVVDAAAGDFVDTTPGDVDHGTAQKTLDEDLYP